MKKNNKKILNRTNIDKDKKIKKKKNTKKKLQEKKDELLAKKLQELEDKQHFKQLYEIQMNVKGENKKILESLLNEEEEEEEEKEEEIHWISSHLNPKKIIWSSNPEILPPSIELKIEEDHFINTFIVKDAKKSKNQDIELWNEEINLAISMINQAKSILIVAGAGMGVDSGLPDYRSSSGFWRAYPPLKKLGLSLEEISHPDWFLNDPEAAWGFYAHRAKLYRQSIPHEGFYILRDIVENKKNNNYFIFTSNIDNQFQYAGFDENKIYECHGSLQYIQCCEQLSKECENKVWKLDFSNFPNIDEETLKAKPPIPKCVCGSNCRPNVSMFGDTNFSFVSTRSEKQKQNLMKWLKKVYNQNNIKENNQNNIKENNVKEIKLLIIEIGCGTSIHSISIESEILIEEDKENQTKLIRINPNHLRKPINNSGILIGLSALCTLKEIKKRLNENNIY